jgi:signal transduction histidine kinase
MSFELLRMMPGVAGDLNLILAVMALIFRKRDELSVPFALMMIGITSDAYANFFFLQQSSTESLQLWIALITVTSLLSFVFVVNFILRASGYHRNLSVKLFGLQIRHFLISLTVFVALVIVLSVFTDVIIASVEITDKGARVILGPGGIPFQILMTMAMIYLFAMPMKASQSQPSHARKIFIHMVMLGLVVLYFGTLVFELVLVQLGLVQQFMSYLSIVISSVIFYIAMLRFQFDKYEELNAQLEELVEERTRHLREAQMRLVRSEKLASLGKLVAGVAHEFNNPIGAVRSSGETISHAVTKLKRILEDRVVDDNELREFEKSLLAMEQSLKVNQSGAERVAEIVKRMLRFSQLDRAEFQPLDVREAVRDTIAMLHSDLTEEIELDLDLGDMPPVRCAAAQINQALYNIVLNAVEAVYPRGSIAIRTRQVDGQVCFTVTDTGQGIAEDDLEQVFDPGFTTKSRGVGVGLGLAIAYQVVDDHDGSIAVESTPGEGTTVTILLPLEQKSHENE